MATTQERWLNGVWGAPVWLMEVFVGVALAVIAAGTFLWLVRSEDSGSPLTADEMAYVGFIAAELDVLGAELTETGYLLQQPDMASPEWRAEVTQGATDIRAMAFYIMEREGAGRFDDADERVDDAMTTYIHAAAMMDEAVETNDEALISGAFEELLAGGKILAQADLSTD